MTIPRSGAMEAAVPLEDERRIRVLIAPIGNMSPEKFDKYCAMLKQFSEVPLSNFHLEIGGEYTLPLGGLLKSRALWVVFVTLEKGVLSTVNSGSLSVSCFQCFETSLS